MTDLNLLRKLAEYQQFPELEESSKQVLVDAGDDRALPLLALAQAHLGDRENALANVAKLEFKFSKLDLDTQVDQIAAMISLLRLGQAVPLLEKFCKQNSSHGSATALLAWCRMHAGLQDEAVLLYQKAVGLLPKRLSLQLNLVGLYLLQKNTVMGQAILNAALESFNELYADLPEIVATRYIAQLRQLQLACWVSVEKFSEAELWLEGKEAELEEDVYLSLLIQYVKLLQEQDCHDHAEEQLRNTLKTYNTNLALLRQLAELVLLQGRTQQAIMIIRRAIALVKSEGQGQGDPYQEASFWIMLSGACLHRAEVQARKAAETACELVNDLLESDTLRLGMIKAIKMQAKRALAQVESQAQNFDLAETLYQELLAENPNFIPALQGLGQQQLQRGEIDQAISLYERVKAIDPVQGLSSLINARQFPEDSDTLQKLENAAHRPSLEGSMRSGLLFQVASAWEKKQDYQKAFSCAQQANTASKKNLKYKATDHRNSCARTRESFCSTLFEHRKNCGVDSSLPVYVLGMPRSGTTLVEQILAGHSQIFGAGELGVIPQVVQGLNRWERHVGSGRQYPDCVDDLTPAVVEGIANNVLKELREFDAGAKHIVDKLPHNFENIGLIKFLFPQAKIISVRRDPRDIAISNYFTDYQAKHGGMGFAYDLDAIGEQLADHNLLMHHWQQLFPDQILDVSYEEVVDDLEGSARRMIDFIGVEWEEQVLDFNKLERTVKTASVWQVRQPIYKTSKARWKRYESHLKPLTEGTNRTINFDKIDMLTLPEAGFLVEGVALYKAGDLDAAELNFQKMLHHNSEHGACCYMLGLVYLTKGDAEQGITLLEKALKIVPWQKQWRENLIKAYEQEGLDEKVTELKERYSRNKKTDLLSESDEDMPWPDDKSETLISNSAN